MPEVAIRYGSNRIEKFEASVRIRVGTNTVRDANKSRNGTIFSKKSEGAVNSKKQPTLAPMAER
jgi:hypothetical protein